MGILKLAMPCALMLLAACATQATRHDSDFDEAPEQVREDWQLTKQRCASCHELDRVFLNMHLFEDEWDIELMVEDMASRPGAGIGYDEVPRIVNALEWHRTR
jgi:hypothetical protein